MFWFEYIQLPRGLKIISNSLPLLNYPFNDFKIKTYYIYFLANSYEIEMSRIMKIFRLWVVVKTCVLTSLSIFDRSTPRIRVSGAQKYVFPLARELEVQFTCTYLNSFEMEQL